MRKNCNLSCKELLVSNVDTVHENLLFSTTLVFLQWGALPHNLIFHNDAWKWRNSIFSTTVVYLVEDNFIITLTRGREKMVFDVQLEIECYKWLLTGPWCLAVIYFWGTKYLKHNYDNIYFLLHTKISLTGSMVTELSRKLNIVQVSTGTLVYEVLLLCIFPVTYAVVYLCEALQCYVSFHTPGLEVLSVIKNELLH